MEAGDSLVRSLITDRRRRPGGAVARVNVGVDSVAFAVDVVVGQIEAKAGEHDGDPENSDPSRLHGFSPLGRLFEPRVSGLLFQRFASGRDASVSSESSLIPKRH